MTVAAQLCVGILHFELTEGYPTVVDSDVFAGASRAEGCGVHGVFMACRAGED